jgi:hypothetical protein
MSVGTVIFALAVFWFIALLPTMYFVCTRDRDIALDWHSVDVMKSRLHASTVTACENSWMYTGPCIAHEYCIMRACKVLAIICATIFALYAIIRVLVRNSV